jgi:hypothetical protein
MIFPSQYTNFKKTCPYLSRHWFLDIRLGLSCSSKWVLCPFETVIIFWTPCICVALLRSSMCKWR